MTSSTARPRKQFIESLEPRRLLAAAVWTGTANDGDWNNAANWQANAIPAADQDITLPFISSSQIDINLDSHPAVGNITVDGNYRFQNSSPKIDGNLTVTANSTNTQFAVIELGHDVTINVATNGEVEFTSPTDNGHDFGITKNGAGNFIFDGGFASIGGVTRVNAGTIELDTADPIPSLDLAPGTTLSGDGSIDHLTANHAVISLSQGTDAQNIGISGTTAIGAGTTLRETISAGFPSERDGQLVVFNSGALDITNASLEVKVFPSAPTLTVGHSFTLIRAINNQPIVGHFKQLPEGGIFTSGGGLWYQINYGNGSSEDVTLTVVNAPSSTTPTIASIMHGSTTATTTQALSILGADTSANGEEGLIYEWTVARAPAGAGAPDFAENNTNSAKNTTITFHKAGQYHLYCVATNLQQHFVAAGVTVRVQQTATGLRITPHAQTIARGATQRFSAIAYDQFGKPIHGTIAPQFTIEQGEGDFNGTSFFIAGPHRGHVLIEASLDGLTGEVGATVR